MGLSDRLRYEPKPLRFGTSGIRGLVSELRDLEVYAFVRGCLDHFRKKGLLSRVEPPPPIPIAGDLRPSTPRILEAVAQAILDAGLRFQYCGTVPTPALTLYGLEEGTASFMVTGSHIPADRNGIKPNRRDGEVLKGDEAGILEAVSSWRERLYGAEETPFDPEGRLQRRPVLGPPIPAAAKAYRRRYALLPRRALQGVRLLFLEDSAVGRDLLPEMVRELGAEVVPVGRSEEFFPIDTEAISEDQLRHFGELAEEAGGEWTALLSTDGDSDRPLVVDLASGSPRFIRGDLLGALVAVELGADAAAVPVSAHPALDPFLARNGIRLSRTKIGSPYVIEAMARLKAQGFRRVVGWEANGGFLVGSEIPYGGGSLRPLPTRDSFLPMALFLIRAVRLGLSPSDLLEPFRGIEGCNLLVDPFPEAAREAFLERFSPPGRAVEADLERGQLFDPEGRPVAEPWPFWREMAGELETLLRMGPIVRLNLLDGVRMRFRDGSLVHLRPSGNAPQMRAYLFAPSRQRLEALAEWTREVIGRLAGA